MRVFLAYAAEDQSHASILKKALEHEGLEVAGSVDVLAPGEVWAVGLTEAISHAQVVVFLVSRESESNPRFPMEQAAVIASANRGESRPVVPVVVGPINRLPYLLAPYQAVFVNNSQELESAGRLIAASVRREELPTRPLSGAEALEDSVAALRYEDYRQRKITALNRETARGKSVSAAFLGVTAGLLPVLISMFSIPTLGQVALLLLFLAGLSLAMITAFASGDRGDSIALLSRWVMADFWESSNPVRSMRLHVARNPTAPANLAIKIAVGALLSLKFLFAWLAVVVSAALWPVPRVFRSLLSYRDEARPCKSEVSDV